MRAWGSLAGWLEASLSWMPVTGVSWCVSLIIALLAAQSMHMFLPGVAAWAVGMLVAGALIGLAQWVMLRPAVKGVAGWMLTTALGWVAGVVITASVTGGVSSALGRFVGVAVGGLVFGWAQGLALNPDAHRGEWLLATAVGWSAALALGSSLPAGAGPGLVEDRILQTAVSGAVGSVMIGLIAVLALVLLFPQPGKQFSDRHVRWWP